MDIGYHIQFSGITHTGLLRIENQDNMVCNSRVVTKSTVLSQVVSGRTKAGNHAIFGVFDGMGGTQCGEAASMIAALNAEKINLEHGTKEGFFDYCIKANNEISTYGERRGLINIGTTVAVLAFGSREISLCNLGDTKVFRISKNVMEQVSKDHIIRFSNKERYLTQNLGSSIDAVDLNPYIALGQYKRGDQYLICSDGLTDMVDENEIVRIINENPFQNVVPELLKTALDHGGRDNITIILCKVLYRWFD